jgi:endonuclease YncB( thermonuclease family)
VPLRRLLFTLFVTIIVPLFWGVRAETLTGRVVGVSDGDTLTLLAEGNRQVRVRLAEIDTPESRQPYGSRAKQALSDLAFGKTARVEVEDTDRYGRTVGRVFVDGTDVNAAMVRQGAAWVYRQYAKDQSLFALEAEARQAKRGLWSLPEAERQPPWEWRHARRGDSGTLRPLPSTVAEAPRPNAGSGLTCGSKRTCGQMASCAEARFYLTQCGLSRLDRDGDGTPCESLCR